MSLSIRRAGALAATVVLGLTAPAQAAMAAPDAGTYRAAAVQCPATGNLTYTLVRAPNPSPDQMSAYALISTAMDQALEVYNCHTSISKALRVEYNPGVPTADGNANGNIRFGARSSMQQATAMHEIAHTLGVGTHPAWSRLLSGGVWTGPAANAELRAITGDPAAVVHGDSQHFWPYGLNYPSEVTSPQDLVDHCRIVVALRADMGLV